MAPKFQQAHREAFEEVRKELFSMTVVKSFRVLPWTQTNSKF